MAKSPTMRKNKRTRNGVTALVAEIDRVVDMLECPSGPQQWIRRSVFERKIAGLLRRAQTVKAQNAMVCRCLKPKLRALGASVKKLKKNATEEHRRTANERYVERRLGNATTDPVLKRLHPAQRKAVVVAEDTQLVLAGAGTGKTQTMASKVADALRRGLATPEQMAVMTFTNKAADEISERISKLAGRSTDGMFVGTIHRLAKQVLIETPGAGGTRIDPIAEEYSSQRHSVIKRMLHDALDANAGLHEALRVRARAHVRFPPNEGEHDGKVTVSLRTGTIDVRSHGEAAICRVLDRRGITFEYEAKYVNAPATAEEWTQHPEAAEAKDQCFKHSYRPDFKVTLNEDFVIWLEHWGVDQEGKPPQEWNQREQREYTEGMERKRRTHAVLKTRLAETSWGQYLEALWGNRDWDSTVVEAIERAAGQDPGSINERFPCKDDDWEAQGETIQVVVQEVDKWIRAAGRCGLEETEIDRRLKNMDMSVRDEAQALAVLARAVRVQYKERLNREGTTDFEEMILDAAKALETGKVNPGFDTLIVDEWQDVNGAQERFVRALSRHGGTVGKRPTLCVVGDDWQSIFGFQGGDPVYTRNFPLKDDACERTDLTQTWRFGQRRAQATREWALGDANAVDKQVEGDEKMDTAAAVTEIVGRTITPEGTAALGESAGQDSADAAVRGILHKIGEGKDSRKNGARVLLVARRRNTVADRNRSERDEAGTVLREWRMKPWLIPRGVNRENEDDVGAAARELARKRTAEGLDHKALDDAAQKAGVTLDLKTMTVHGAKGLEADYVIFVQGRDRRVGTELREGALNRALRPLLPASANSAEEERRVWYVALTRAKSVTYVVEPPHDAADTTLFNELWRDENRDYGTGEAELAEWLEPYRGDTTCPRCTAMGQTGRLVERTGRESRNRFVGCTSYRYKNIADARPCGHTERRCPRCARGVVRRLDGAGRTSGKCTDRECQEMIPLCGCNIPKPMAIRVNSSTGERFWGCQDYRGPEKPACGQTQPLDMRVGYRRGRRERPRHT